MVFQKQFTRRQLAILTPSAGPRELASLSSSRVFATLIGIDDLFHHYISPALTTRELLRLAATCKELRDPARALVTQVCVRQDVARHSAVSRAVQIGIPLLPGLRVLDLSFVHLGPREYSSLASALLSPTSRPHAFLQVFRVRQRGEYSPRPLNQGSTCLFRFLQGVVATCAWPMLEEVDVSGHCLGDAAVKFLGAWMEGRGTSDPTGLTQAEIKQQNQPERSARSQLGRRLRRLGLSSINMSQEGLMYLLRLLASGRCPSLLRVDLSGNACGCGGKDTVWGMPGAPSEEARKRYLEALWTAALYRTPNLLELDVGESGVEGEVCLGLVNAWRHGACRKLKRLSLGGCPLTDKDTKPFFQALKQGSCPWLQDLDLREACLETEAFTGVAVVLEARYFRRLRCLDLSENLLTYEGTFRSSAVDSILAQVSSFPCFLIASHSMFYVLEYRVLSPPFPALLSGMQEIVRGLQLGGAPLLRSLRLSSTGLEFDEVNEMVHLWCEKLRKDGHCPLLQGDKREGGREGIREGGRAEGVERDFAQRRGQVEGERGSLINDMDG